MNREQFWELIGRSLKAENNEEQIEFLENELGKLPQEEIAEFDYIFRQLHEDAYTWDLWAAAYTIQGGCSDDGFIDFRAWLVFRGKEVFEKALTNPDSLAELGRDVLEESEDAEDFYYIAGDVYEETMEVAIEDDPNFKDVVLKDEPIGKDWNEDNLDELRERNPNLFKLFWK